MKNLICAATFISLAWCNFATAIPVSAFSGADVSNTFVVAGGGALPALLDSQFTGAIFSNQGQSVLNAPDAIPFEDSLTTDAGFNAANPSIFYQTSSATRNLGSEGGITSSNHSMYREREAGDTNERVVNGEASALASLTSDVYQTSASSNVVDTSSFRITNDNQNAITFAIQGIFEMNIFSIASGVNAFTESYAFLDLFFESSHILDIQYADIEPYILNEDNTDVGSMVSIERETNVSSTGHLNMTGYSSTSNGNAFGASRMGYILGITLQAGETITMDQRTRYSTLAQINLPVQVSEPRIFALLMLSMLGLLLKDSVRNTQA
ncbi:hypothetical protein [uncultured Paraglaciecola sp.]|uniref:hypothetical protein n=1 Tax=uncultured Paraglaciecola sp. TaxID=1765024 RepID=UPI0030D9C93E|tara:strand:- start:67212 stop:68183 length:972 start_codon:yes stop_codon:yes gene_type:complete